MFKTIMRIGWIGLLGLAFAISGYAEMPKKPEGRVSDFAKVISVTQKAEINGLLEGVENSTGAQIAVVTVASLDGLSVEEYATALFNQWGIGQKGKDNGVLLLVAPRDRKVKIEVGYGLEGTIPDGLAGRILDESVVPYFKANEVGQGILHGCERIANCITGEEHTTSSSSAGSSSDQSVSRSSNGSELGWKEKTFIICFFGLFITIGFIALGIGLREGGFFIIWGAGFGGIPLLMSLAFGLAMGFPIYILPIWGGIMLGVGLVFGKKISKALAATPGGHSAAGHSSATSTHSSFSGGFSSGSSFSSFGGGSSGGGGSSRSW